MFTAGAAYPLEIVHFIADRVNRRESIEMFFGITNNRSVGYLAFGFSDYPDDQRMNHSMSEELMIPLDQLQNWSRQLFLSLSPPATKPPLPPPTSAFLECDQTLAATLRLARTHQIKQRRIEELKREVLELEENLREVFKELENGRLDLEEILDEADTRVKAIDKAKAG